VEGTVQLRVLSTIKSHDDFLERNDSTRTSAEHRYMYIDINFPLKIHLIFNPQTSLVLVKVVGGWGKVIKPDRPKSAQAKLEPKWRRIVGFVMCEYIYIYMKDLRRGMSIYIYI